MSYGGSEKTFENHPTTRRLDAFRSESWTCGATGVRQATGACRLVCYRLRRVNRGQSGKTLVLLLQAIPAR